MPRRTNKSDGGNLFNISNLEQAKQLMQQINDIMNKQHSGAQEYMEDTEKLTEYYRELSKLSKENLRNIEFQSRGNKNNDAQKVKDYLDSLKEIIKLQEQELDNEAAKQILVEQRKETIKTVNEIEKNQKKLMDDKLKIEEAATKMYQKQLKVIQKQAEKEYDSMTTTQKLLVNKNKFVQDAQKAYKNNFQQNLDNAFNNAYDTGGSFTIKDLKSVNDASMNGVNLNAKQFVEGTKRLNIASNILQVAGEGLKKSISIIKETFIKGINEQSEIYEKTFQDISTRTGVDNPTYFANQHSTMTTLMAQGLNDNIKVSEVQSMWESLAKNGMNEQDMFANALDNVITKNIVPYLDTTSQEFNLLNTRLDGNFVKQIRGINQANLDIAGNNYLTQELLQTIIDEVQPMSDEALQNLAQGSAEVTSMINKMVASGWSEDAAKSYATQLFKSQKYGDQVMRSGSVSEKYSMISAIEQGVNIYDPTQFNDFMGVAVNTDQMLASAMPGYNTTLNGVITNTGGTALGIDYARMQGAKNGKLTGTQLTNLSNLTSDALNNYSSNAYNTFNSGANQTSKTRQETTLENLSTDVAIAKEYMGKVYDVLESILGAVWKLASARKEKKILGSVGGKFLGNTAGKTLGTGLGTKALNAVGSGLMDVGFSAGYTGNSVAGAIGTGAATTLGAAALVGGGTALGVNGISDAVQDFQSGKTGRGVASTVQGAAGLGAAGVAVGSGIAAAAGGAGLAGGIAAAATNPVGWVLLAAAGGIALGKSLYDSAHNYEKAGVKVEKEFNDLAFNLEQEQMKREENLLSIKDNLKNNKDLEEQRQKLIQTGLLSDEDLQKAQKGNRDALIELTNQYIKSTKDFSNTEQELLEQIKNDKVDEANESAKSIKDWFDNDLKGKNGDTKENNEIAKNLIVNTASQLENKGRSNWSDSEKKFMERYEKNKRDNNKWGYKDLRWILEGGGSWGGISDAVMDNATDIFNNTGFATYANSRGKNIKQYESIDMNMLPYATAIKQATNKEEAETAVKAAKDAGMKYSEWKQYIGDVLTEYKIPEFRYGTNEIPYDGYPALLHQGEAVLTASTANEMRNLVDEYRDGKDTSANFDVIIESQTVAIVEKMDEIIAIMNNMSSPLAQQTVNSNSSAKASQLNNMVRMRNSKSWA